MGKYPGPKGRARAKKLRAADALTLVNSTLPLVGKMLTEDQLGQIQKVLDAVVVNPDAKREYAELMRKSVIAGTGQYVNRDPAIVRKADKVFEEQIYTDASDKRVRLAYSTLLTHGALEPTTDNPDEAIYLRGVRQTLENEGIWLRFDYKPIRDPTDPSRWIVDPRSFEVWLSLGSEGGYIPTTNGRLDREALLGNTRLGANYYRNVGQGSVQTILKSLIERIENQVTDGEALHNQQSSARRTAAPGVAEISDFFGNADFPSDKIWKLPRSLVLDALNQNVGGNVKNSSISILYAANAAHAAASVLDQYIYATTKGAQRVVKVLNFLKTAGEVAEALLIVRALVGGLVRLLAVESAERAAAEGAARIATKNTSPAAYYPTNYVGREAFNNTLKIGNTMRTDAGVGSAMSRLDLAAQKKIAGWHDDFVKGVETLYKSKGDTWGSGWVVSREEFVALDEAASAKWGDIWKLYD